MILRLNQNKCAIFCEQFFVSQKLRKTEPSLRLNVIKNEYCMFSIELNGPHHLEWHSSWHTDT